MDLQMLTAFFMWCTIINFGILMLSSVVLMFASDFVYGVHSKWFQISRESYNVVMYSYLGLFKVGLIVFSLVPYLALLIIA